MVFAEQLDRLNALNYSRNSQMQTKAGYGALGGQRKHVPHTGTKNSVCVCAKWAGKQIRTSVGKEVAPTLSTELSSRAFRGITHINQAGDACLHHVQQEREAGWQPVSVW